MTRSALTFLVATAVHAKQCLLNLPQMEVLVVVWELTVMIAERVSVRRVGYAYVRAVTLKNVN